MKRRCARFECKSLSQQEVSGQFAHIENLYKISQQYMYIGVAVTDAVFGYIMLDVVACIFFLKKCLKRGCFEGVFTVKSHVGGSLTDPWAQVLRRQVLQTAGAKSENADPSNVNPSQTQAFQPVFTVSISTGQAQGCSSELPCLTSHARKVWSAAVAKWSTNNYKHLWCRQEWFYRQARYYFRKVIQHNVPCHWKYIDHLLSVKD